MAIAAAALAHILAAIEGEARAQPRHVRCLVLPAELIVHHPLETLVAVVHILTPDAYAVVAATLEAALGVHLFGAIDDAAGRKSDLRVGSGRWGYECVGGGAWALGRGGVQASGAAPATRACPRRLR